MIEFFRRASESLIARIFFGFLALSFAVMWGGQEGLRMIGVGRDATVAKVGSETISNRDLALAIERFRVMARSQGGGEISAQEIRAAGLDRQLLETLIADSLVRQEAKTLDISVSDDYVIKKLRANPMFKRPDGTFSKETFQRFISNFGFASEKDYVQYMKSEILRSRLIQALSANASLPLVSHKPLFAWNEQVRTATAMIIDPSQVKLEAEPTIDELRDYYGKNQRQFFVPERRTFTALVVPTKAIKTDVKSADVDILYDLEKDKTYKDVKAAEAKRLIREQLTREALQAAMIEKSTAIQEAFDEGATLTDIAAKHGYTLRTFTDMTEADKGGKRTPQDQAMIAYAFTVPVSELSPLEEIDGGAAYVAVYVDGVKEPSQLSFADAHAELKDAVAADMRVAKTKSMIEAIEADLKAGKPFKSVAAQYKAKVVTMRASRQKMLAPTPADMMTAQPTRLFIVPNGGMTILPFAVKGVGVKYALAKITDVKNGNPQRNPKDFQAFADRLVTQTESDIYQLYVTDLRSRYDVDVNKSYFAQ